MTAMVRGPTPINILLVEDAPSDVERTRRGLQRAKLQNRVWVVGDGAEALAFLRREGPHRGVPRPDLVLLDLKLPGLDGRDVLMRIREEPRWQALPVVVLTGSDAERSEEHTSELQSRLHLVCRLLLEKKKKKKKITRPTTK